VSLEERNGEKSRRFRKASQRRKGIRRHWHRGSRIEELNAWCASLLPAPAQRPSCAHSACGPGVTRITRGLRFMNFVTSDTAAHGCDARVLRHHIELSDVTVTRHALHAGLQVLPMCPGNSRRDLIDAYPRNRLVRFCELSELYDRRPIFGYSHMTSHARARGGKRHLIAGIGIGVAGLALQSPSDVRFVTERERLVRSRMRREVLSHFLLGSLRRLLCPCDEAQ
jgi:hypothetical protein